MTDELRKRLRDLMPVGAQLAVVKSVDVITLACEVVLLENQDVRIYNVSLSAQESKAGLVCIPRVESLVLIGEINGLKENRYVLMFSEIDRVIWRAGNEDLKLVLFDLLAAIRAITVQTGVGPSSHPVNQLDFQNIEDRLNGFFQ